MCDDDEDIIDGADDDLVWVKHQDPAQIIIIIIVIIFLSCLIHIAAWNDLSFVYIIGAKYISFVRQFIGMMITEHFLLITQILMIITQMLMLITKSKPY